MQLQPTPPAARGQTVELDSARWSAYFDDIAGDRSGLLASVGVLSDGCDGRRRRIGRPLRTIGYDPLGDVLEVGVGGRPLDRPALRYFLSSPRAVMVTESQGERAILVDDATGARTSIRLFHRWRPAPGATQERAVADRVIGRGGLA